MLEMPLRTKTGPVIAFAGTGAVSVVDAAVSGLTSTVPELVVNTTELLALNPAPVNVTVESTTAREGETDVNEAVGSVIKELVDNIRGNESLFKNCRLPLLVWPFVPLNRMN